jgi:hypothetical protein
MAAKEISVKKYVVRLSGEEREQLEALTPIPMPASGPFSSLGRIRRPASLRTRRSRLFAMCWIRSATPARSARPRNEHSIREG